MVFYVPTCAEASSIPKESTSYHNYLKGLLLDGEGDHDKAKRAFEKASKFDSGSWDIHYRLGLDYVRLQDFKNAERELGYLLELKPQEEQIRFLLARVYSYDSELEKSIEEHIKLLERPLLQLRESDVRLSLMKLYIQQKDMDSAELECKTILKNNPDFSNAHFYLGYIYSETSRVDNAIGEFNRAIEINPNNILALNSLSYLYTELGIELDSALTFVKKALEFEPSNASFLDTLGWVYFKKGDLENALRYIENASVLIEDAEVYDHLGEIHLEMGDVNEAKKNWKKSLKIDPKREQVKEKIEKLNKR